ncbi:hyaluronidase [Nocardioides sp. KC13]|uniref:Hyaluronidase n=1 Tax=Nocardioides turkmenicus TaxID=2711220 RepID=A0A6M1R120_9ACTN|nr:beta-N-acetylglucosaminidase domain-containing protein [Nocardioides sp. KC13]NGN93402.1 hyaluronidase [Nocardioides sp. KC13]
MRERSRKTVVITACVAAAAALVATAAFVPPSAAGAGSGPVSAAAQPLPTVSPTPRSMTRAGADLTVPERVELVVGDDTDAPARELVGRLLREHGATRLDVVGEATGTAPLTVLLGSADRGDVRDGLGGVEVPEVGEGYALLADASSAGVGTVTLAGHDTTGQFYAAQTLRQLFVATDDGWRIAGAEVSDAPRMPLRGSIEGFYGKPWTHAERVDQLRFYGRIKANTYVYAPKDDPYHRERWREPYPADKLAELSDLVDTATANHVRFTFALSPGNTICYSGASDRAALVEKFQAMYDIGVRDFSLPLDDIALSFSCADDTAAYGQATQASVGRAQAELLSWLQTSFVETHEGARPLQTVPTQYGDLTETPYKQAWREHLDPEVVVMWTGTDVVPPSITVDQASAASDLFGRKVFVWDNYPVNDFGQTAGRLLLGPYANREAGLSGHLAGIVSNPMNQAYASKLVVFTMMDFAWNDLGWDRATSAHQAARDLADGDPRVTEAVEMFVDLNHAAPTFGPDLWLPQSPRLAARTAAFWQQWKTQPQRAVRGLRPTARLMASTPETIRAGVEDGFVADADRHLQATDLWADAMGAALDVLDAVRRDDADAAGVARSRMEDLAEKASQVRSEPGKNRVEGLVMIGDGVLDAFLEDVAAEHDAWLGLPPLRNVSEGKAATQVSDWSAAYGAAKAVNGSIYDFSTTSGREAQPWWQVDLGESFDLEEVRIYNRVDCCAERVRGYHVLVSDAPFPATLAEALADPAVTSHFEADQAGRPTSIELPARGRYVRVWLSSPTPTELNVAEVQVLGRSVG